MAESAAKRFLAIVQFRSDSTPTRIRDDAPTIIEFIKRISNGEHELAFRSPDGLFFGYFIKTDQPPRTFQSDFMGCTGSRDGDGFLLFEVGVFITATGPISRAGVWLQRH
ncbi:hypothetical protein [Methylocella sp.]|jgi:hypothetical protein|uniref:hypothetical protein n=1 Tax=Methylocella sp. TaxID=1978226 RepID=UPI003C292885